MSLKIAIDGPAGAGKSTIAKGLAKKLNAIYVDTGAMYRAIGLYVLRNGIDKNDETAVVEAVSTINVSIVFEDGQQVVLLIVWMSRLMLFFCVQIVIATCITVVISPSY